MENPSYIAKTRPGYWMGGGKQYNYRDIETSNWFDARRAAHASNRASAAAPRKYHEKAGFGAAARSFGRISGPWFGRAAGILSLGLVLIVDQQGFGLRAARLPPAILLDNVIGKHQCGLLLPLTLAVVGATAFRASPRFR